jgi:hypothetical protein
MLHIPGSALLEFQLGELALAGLEDAGEAGG